IIETTLNEVPSQNLDTLASVVENDQLSRQLALSLISKSD
ncbi:MAG: 1-deoxy-D-xylulose-5-phosphate reductoisomerase, partial [Thiotrichales bacterium]|nr:1-deoxy-D-xylulose-5-phosphate reductoisomerase [Thiotrichales bacterium]